MNPKSTIKLSDIKVGFGSENPPKDDYMIGLLSHAYKGELLCYMAIIKIEGIKPFSDYKPEISERFKNWFERKIAAHSPPPIYVYPKDDVFIMSDDYSAYNLYLKKGNKEMLCIVLGQAKGPHVIEKGKPFKLTPPTAEIMSE